MITNKKLNKLIHNALDSSKNAEIYYTKLMRIFIKYELNQDQLDRLERAKQLYGKL